MCKNEVGKWLHKWPCAPWLQGILKFLWDLERGHGVPKGLEASAPAQEEDRLLFVVPHTRGMIPALGVSNTLQKPIGDHSGDLVTTERGDRKERQFKGLSSHPTETESSKRGHLN